MLRDFRFQIVALIASLSLVGCATQRLDPSSRQRIHSVGVVSLLGEDVHIEFRGTTAFGNRSFEEHAPDFALDSTAEHAATQTLGSQYHVATLGMAGRAVLPPVHPASNIAGFIQTFPYWNPDSSQVGTAVRQICATQHLDAVVIIYSSSIESEYGNFRGVGLSGANVFGMKNFNVGAVIRLALYDSNGKLLLKGYPSGHAGEFDSAIKDFPWQHSLAQYTPEQRRVLISKVQELVKLDTQGALEGMGLLGK